MCKEIVDYLQNNPIDNDGFPLFQHLVESEFPSLQEYLQYMARKNTFGDQLTLFAAANLYNIDLQIASTLGAGAQHVFHPSSSIPLATVYLSHFAENHGERYVSLIREFNSDTSTSDDHTGPSDVDAGGVNDDVGNVNNDASDVNNDAGDGNNDAGDVHSDAGDYHNDAGDVHDDADVVDDDVGDVDTVLSPS